MQKAYPPVENYDNISSADELPRKKRKKGHSDSNSDHKSRRKLKAKKKSRQRKRKLSTSDSSSSESSDSDDCIGGRAAAKKIHTGSDSVVTNPDWVFLQTDELTAARERLSTDIHVRLIECFMFTISAKFIAIIESNYSKFHGIALSFHFNFSELF